MEFDELAVALSRLDRASIVRKPDVLRQLLSDLPVRSFGQVAAIIAGEPIVENPHHPSRRHVEAALATASGRSLREVRKELRRWGNLPETAEQLLRKKSQTGLGSPGLTLEQGLRLIEELLIRGMMGSASVPLRALLSRCGPLSARLALGLLLGESHAWVPENLLVTEVSRLLPADEWLVRALVRESGWRRAVERLTKRLPGASETIIRGSGNGEEGGKNRTQEGDPEPEGQTQDELARPD